MKNHGAKDAIRIAVSFMILSMFSWPAAAGEAGYRAVVMDLKGQAFVMHAGARKALDFGFLLYSGDSVETMKGAFLTVTYLDSGQEEQWVGEAAFVVEKNSSKPAPAQIKMTKRIILPKIESPQQAGTIILKGIPGGILDDIDLFKVGDLSNTRIIEEKPAFSWDTVSRAQNYRVQFYRFPDKEPVWQRTTKDKRMSFPSDAPLLEPGHKYSWIVEALNDGSVIAKKCSSFSLPPRDEFAEIRKEADAYRAQLESGVSDVATRLRFIFFLEEHQLYDNALEQYGILQRQHGESKSLKDRREKLIELRSLTCQTN